MPQFSTIADDAFGTLQAYARFRPLSTSGAFCDTCHPPTRRACARLCADSPALVDGYGGAGERDASRRAMGDWDGATWSHQIPHCMGYAKSGLIHIKVFQHDNNKYASILEEQLYPAGDFVIVANKTLYQTYTRNADVEPTPPRKRRKALKQRSTYMNKDTTGTIRSSAACGRALWCGAAAPPS
eukprot:5413366-Pleurochrysis_carterae.AAC.2